MRRLWGGRIFAFKEGKNVRRRKVKSARGVIGYRVEIARVIEDRGGDGGGAVNHRADAEEIGNNRVYGGGFLKGP